VLAHLGSRGHPAVRAEDFLPLPCGHPLCYSLAFYLCPAQGPPVSVAGLLKAEDLLDCVANRGLFGSQAEEFHRLRDLIYGLWSGPSGSAPQAEAVMNMIRGLLRELSAGGRFDPRRAFRLTERRVKSIFIHAFQDADTFDLARVRKCCYAYPQADGRLVPACVHNVLGRTS